MRAGPMRHRATLQTYTPTRDATGGVVESWTDVATVYARVEPIRGREALEAEQILAEADTRVTIRYGSEWAAINPSWRVLCRNVVYNIVHVVERNLAHREYELLVKSGVNNG